jgi:putative copper export protein
MHPQDKRKHRLQAAALAAAVALLLAALLIFRPVIGGNELNDISGAVIWDFLIR